MNTKTLDALSIVVVVIEIVWRFIMEKISAPQWMHYVEWGLIILIFLLIVLHFISRRREKK